MKKYQIVMAFIAVFAFSAVAVASASAETTLLAEWLFNGAAVTALLSVETSGNLNLSTLVLGIDAVEILCEGIFDGSVGPNGEDEITAVLTTPGKEEVSKTALSGVFINCTTQAGSATEECGKTGALAEVWPLNLPWHTNLFLMESGTFLDSLFAGTGETTQPGYEVRCVSGGKAENTCRGNTSSTITNGTTDVMGAFDSTSEKVKCTTGEGDLIGTGLTADTSEGTLSVSSE
jgi:hypothetical protein